ncbi:MAG: hypothetical protein ABIS92_06760 [Polyangia bacterium]
MILWGRWRTGLLLVLLATAARLGWTLAVPTIPVGDFATYRESALYLAEFGHLDPGFVYMPGLVMLLALLHSWGGDVVAAKMLGVAFGGLAAAPVYVIAARLFVNGHIGEHGQPPGSPNPGPRASTEGSQGREAAALVAGLGYALWPAGIALSSVIGTDIPTAALILFALAVLCTWGGTRPMAAALAFGAGMGLAAYFRAVALPLTVLSAGYWLAMRASWRATLVRTGLAVAITVLVLVPWGLRNLRRNGQFYLTDSHGGITALMGNDPNTEGTYSRLLATTFKQLTGRTFLMEPHRVTDRAAYALAKQWMMFDPAWTAGMIALRTERLFAPERGLLYWPVYRPGVVPPATAAWFNQHRPLITGLADLFYLLLVLGVTAGAAFAVVERRWTVLVPVPFALMQAAIYALFVAEPRYRLTTEVLLFPLFGFGLFRMISSAVRVVLDRVEGRAASPGGGSSSAEPLRIARAGLVASAAGVLLLAGAAWVVVRGGQALRTRHRWAATVWTVDGRSQLALWRAGPGGRGASPVRGAPPGAAFRLDADRLEARAEIILPGVTVGEGSMAIQGVLSWRGPGVVEPNAELAVQGVLASGAAPRLSGVLAHGAGPLRLDARLSRTAGGPGGELAGELEAVLSDVVLTTRGP